MITNFLFAFLLILSDPTGFQVNEGKLFLELSGTAIEEGKYKSTASLTFYEFDEKCKIRFSGKKIKLNKKTPSAIRSYTVGKPVIVYYYYSDLRTQYGRSTGGYLVFHLENGKNYSMVITVEDETVKVRVLEKKEGSEQKEVALLRGYEHVKCQ